jgi:hypothetical protein
VYCYNSARQGHPEKAGDRGQTDTTYLRLHSRRSVEQGQTTPDGTVITYAFNSNGLHQQREVDTQRQHVAAHRGQRVTYLPFGPINSYTLGNGQTVTRTYDANYRPRTSPVPGSTCIWPVTSWAMSRRWCNAPGANPATESYQYDPLYRLTSVTEANGVNAGELPTTRPATGLSKTASGLATGAYLYTSGTHQLASIGNAPAPTMPMATPPAA